MHKNCGNTNSHYCAYSRYISIITGMATRDSESYHPYIHTHISSQYIHAYITDMATRECESLLKECTNENSTYMHIIRTYIHILTVYACVHHRYGNT